MWRKKLLLVAMGLMCIDANASAGMVPTTTQQWVPALPRHSKTAPSIMTSKPTTERDRGVGELTHNCSLCTKEQCVSTSKMLECLSFCSSDLKSCMEAIPLIENSNDANKYGNIQYKKLMKKLYGQYPLSKYWLDERSETKSGSISSSEKEQLGSALKEIGKKCSAIVKKIEIIVNANMRTTYSKKSKEMLKEFKEIEHDLLGQSSSIINNIPTSDRKNLKKSVSDVLLLAKNCFNQGEVAFFNTKEEASRSVTEILKRKIMPKK